LIRGGTRAFAPHPGQTDRFHHVRLKPALRLFESSPDAVSLTEPVTLNGPPNSFCSALSVRSHLSSLVETEVPSDTLVSVGSRLSCSAWLEAQICDGGCAGLYLVVQPDGVLRDRTVAAWRP